MRWRARPLRTLDRWMCGSVLVALFGAVVRVLVGIGAGAAIVVALADDGFVFSANFPGLLLVLIAGFVAGLLASILPARRASRTTCWRRSRRSSGPTP